MVILCLSIQLSHSVMSDSLQPHEWQHAGLPCPSPTPGAYSNSCPSSRWFHPTISLSVVPFSSLHQSFPASGSYVLCLYTWLKLHEAVYLVYVCLVHNYVFLFKNNKKNNLWDWGSWGCKPISLKMKLYINMWGKANKLALWPESLGESLSYKLYILRAFLFPILCTYIEIHSCL